MPKDAKIKEDEYEPSVVISDDVRVRSRARREKLKRAGDPRFAQRQFSKRLGVSPGTISNIETGSQKTLPREICAKWQRELFGDAAIPVDSFDRVARLLASATESQIANLLALAKVIKDADEEEIEKVIALYRLVRKPKEQG